MGRSNVKISLFSTENDWKSRKIPFPSSLEVASFRVQNQEKVLEDEISLAASVRQITAALAARFTGSTSTPQRQLRQSAASNTARLPL